MPHRVLGIAVYVLAAYATRIIHRLGRRAVGADDHLVVEPDLFSDNGTLFDLLPGNEYIRFAQLTVPLGEQIHCFTKDTATILFGSTSGPQAIYHAVDEVVRASRDVVAGLSEKLQAHVQTVDYLVSQNRDQIIKQGTSGGFPHNIEHVRLLMLYRQLYLISRPRRYDDLCKSVDTILLHQYFSTPSGQGESGELFETIVCIALACSVLGDDAPCLLRLLLLGPSGTGKGHRMHWLKEVIGCRKLEFEYSSTTISAYSSTKSPYASSLMRNA